VTQELNNVVQNLNDDRSYLSELTSTHAQKSKEFKLRMEDRRNEITAIKEAIQIMQSPAVSKGGVHVEKTALMATSLIQLSSSKRDIDADVGAERLSSFLRKRGEDLKSKMLLQLAEVAQADPFAKVKKMIQNLLTKLRTEMKKDAETKGWCDTEMAKNKAQTEELTSKVSTLSSRIEVLKADIAKRKDMIKTLDTELEELRTDKDTAVSNRNAEKASNEQTIKETKEAVVQVERAMQVLQTYYNSVKFLQQPEEPAYAGGEYKGMSGQSTGVIGLLEVVLERMNTLVSETTAAEADAAKEHEDFLTKNHESTETKKSDRSGEKTLLAENGADLESKKGELTTNQSLLDDEIKYKQDAIDPKCIAQGMTFEEKTKKREEEITSLKEALSILSEVA